MRLGNSSCLPVRPSVRKENSESMKGFSWNLKFENFSKICLENSSFIKIKKRIWGTLREHKCTVLTKSRQILLRMIYVSEKSCTGNQNTHFVFSNFFYFFRKSCRLRDNVERYCRAGQDTEDSILLRRRFACSKITATDTVSEYVILIVFFKVSYLRL